MSVGGLAGHLARSVLQVEWFLDGQVVGAEPVSPVRYYARLADTSLPDSALNVGVRARNEETAAAGPAAVAEQARAAWVRLSQRLGMESPDRRVAVPSGGDLGQLGDQQGMFRDPFGGREVERSGLPLLTARS